MSEHTRILHSIPVDPLTGAVSVPLYQTSTFVQQAPGEHQDFDYSRTNNPTRQVLERMLADLERGARGLAFASGLAAIDAVVKLLDAGDHVVAVDDIYGGAYRLFEHVYKRLGITVTYVDTADVKNVEAALLPNTKAVWLESPTNPTLKVSDIPAIAAIAKQHGLLLVVDNTFASPIAQRPIELGADLVVHSLTKYIAGHSDVIGGAVIAATDELGDRVKFIQNASGAVLGPFDSWLTIRGIQTLALRVERHARNAQAVAEALLKSEVVHHVYYPGLKQHRNYAVAKRQQRYFGGVVAFDLKVDDEALTKQLVSGFGLFKLAESLGGPKSLVCHPASMTHKSVPREQRYRAGVTDSLVRLSVGLEDPEDLIADLHASLERVKEQWYSLA